MKQLAYIAFLFLSLNTLHAQCNDCYFYVTATEGCEDGKTKLTAATNGIFLEWDTPMGDPLSIASPNAKMTVVRPKKTTTYVATAKTAVANLITNGNFDNGLNGFTTAYTIKNTAGLFDAGSDITFEVAASDTDGSITAVDFYNGSTLLGTDNTFPYSYTWTSVATGEYFIRAIATDNDGATTTSKLFPLQVGNSIDNSSEATLTKKGSGSSSQSIAFGAPLDDFYYEWSNATTVEVYGLPAGVTASIDNTNKEVSFSGTPTQEGTFDFTVLTIGGVPNATKNGTITVTGGSGNIAPTVAITWPYDGLEFDAGDLGIGANPNEYNSSFVNKKDHTGNNGSMLIVDGSLDDSRAVYSTTLAVTGGKEYLFDMYASNIHKLFLTPTDPTLQKPTLGIFIDGTLMLSTTLPNDVDWHNLRFEWTATMTGNVTLDIRDLNEAKEENDFALDDIGFYETQVVSEAVEVSPCVGKNIFSPDGDGQYDDFFIDGSGTAKIYSPGGTLIKTLSLPNYWDGTDTDGNLVNAGYYAIIINEAEYTNVTVVR